MALGSLLLWTFVPFGWLRLAASLSDRYVTIYMLALLGCPVAMLLWGWGLYRINRVYLRFTDATGVGRSHESRPVLLEVLLVASAVIALAILLVWWLALAHSPTSTPIPDEFSGGPS